MQRIWPIRFPSGIRRLLVGVLLLNMIVLGLVGLALWRSYNQHQDSAQQSAINLSRVLEENLSRFVDKVDLTLLATLDEIDREEKSGGIDRAALERFLAVHDARMPEALGLRVVNAQGRIEYAANNITTPNASVADREHFIRHRDDPNLGLFISKPVVGRLSPQPMIILARRRTAPDGSFNGIVHVAVALSSLSYILSTVDVGPLGNVGLWGDEPVLLARHALVAAATNGVTTPSPILQKLIASNAGPRFYHTRSGVDGIVRLFYYRRVSHWPLYLIIGTADDDILDSWKHEVAAFGGLAILFLLASLAAAGVVSGQIEALERSRRSEVAARRYSDLILSSAGEGICGINASGKVTFINAAARRMLGWQPDDGLGEDFHSATHHHHADGSPYLADDCPMHKILVEGSDQIIHVDQEVYWRRDGSCFPVEYTVTPMVEADGTVGVVNVFHDITGSVRAAQEIKGLLSKLQAVLHNTPIGVAILDFQRTIIEANEAFCLVYGRQDQDLIGQSARLLYGDPDQYEDIGRRAYPLIQQGQTFQDDVSMIRSDGSQVWVRLVAHLVDAQNPEMGVVWAAEDISNRKALELELKRSNIELEQFAYVASHDLRQPLRMVVSYMELLQRKLGPTLDDEANSFMGFAVGGAKRMDRLILDLLDYARIGKNAIIQPVPLTDAVQDALQNLEPAIKEASAQITAMKDFPIVMGDIVELTRLFQNLVGNAIKYRAQDRAPVIDMGWRASAGEWIIWVKDNGIGIAPEDRERAFQIFQRLVPKDAYEGSGIGLAVCQKIVTRHGGRIWIKSDNDEGTTFIFTLPSKE